MKTIHKTLGETEVELAANFKASVEIADKVCDPLAILKSVATEAMMLENGIPYNPDFEFDVRNIAAIIYIGMKAADKGVRHETVQDLVFDAGLMEAREVALHYITFLASGGRELPAEDSAGGAKPSAGKQ